MNKSYSEQRAQILFRASRELRAVAADVLGDEANAGVVGRGNARWTVVMAAKTARRANELENEAHESCVATARQESDLRKSHAAYAQSVIDFEARVRLAGNVPAGTSVIEWANEGVAEIFRTENDSRYFVKSWDHV